MAKPRQSAKSGDDWTSSALDLLADLSAGFAAGADLEHTLNDAVRRITEYLDADGGALFLLEEEGKTLRCHACIGSTEITGISLPSDRGIVGRCVQTNRGEIVRDVSQDPGFYQTVDEQTGYTTRSILCAPLSVRDEQLGAIELVNKRSTDGLFDATDLMLLETLAASAALAILNTRMAARLVDQERLQRELELAAEIQRNLLPGPTDHTSPIHGLNVPAHVVSGDFYDFFTRQDGCIVFCIGDVSGKGMNAALLMAKTASLFRGLGRNDAQPGKLLARINREILETSTRGMFVTMISGLYDPATRSVRFANAGHHPPLLYRGDGGIESFETAGLPLGIMEARGDAMPYPEIDLEIGNGSFYLFTDGLTEGLDRDGSSEKLERLLTQQHSTRVTDRLNALVAAATQQGSDVHDDITVVAIEPVP